MNNKWVVFLTLAVVSSYAMEQQQVTNYDDLALDTDKEIVQYVLDDYVATFGINSDIRSVNFSSDGSSLSVSSRGDDLRSRPVLANFSAADWNKKPTLKWHNQKVKYTDEYWRGFSSSNGKHRAMIYTQNNPHLKEVTIVLLPEYYPEIGKITIDNISEIPKALSDDACYIASGNHSLGADTSVRIRSVPDNKVVNSVDHGRPVRYVAISPDDKYIASADDRRLVVRDFFNCVLDPKKEEKITTIRDYIFVKTIETNKRKKVFLLNEDGRETWQKLKDVFGQDFTLYKRSVKLKQRKTGDDELSDNKSIDRWALVRTGCKITDK